MKQKILLLGRNGQLGWELKRTLATLGSVVALGRSELDLVSYDRIRQIVKEIKPGLIVNAAAYSNVDGAEVEPELAMLVNGEVPTMLASVAKEYGAGLVHFSTDYVFDGKKETPYSEDDSPNPLNAYGRTKLAGEEGIQSVGYTHLIIRTSWLYGSRGHNFFLSILRNARERDVLRVVDDQFGCPTWSRELAEACTRVLAKLSETSGRLGSWDQQEAGLLHMVGAGETSWFGFAKQILAGDVDPEAPTIRELIPVSTLEYGSTTSRPAYSVLATDRLRNIHGMQLRTWRDQLEHCWDAVQKEGSEELIGSAGH